MRYLTFQLYGPLQSYGDVAVGELRPTRAMPTRSALCGLVAAALGIRRSDAADLAGIRDGYDIGVAQVRAGSSLRDFHTVQAASTGAKKTFYCRRDEMADSDVNTLVSFRDYLENAFFLVCLGERACAPHSLESVARALRRPRFTLFLGRKGCPPALPLHPVLKECSSMVEALSAYESDACVTGVLPSRGKAAVWRVESDTAWPLSEETIFVRDQAESHQRRQFALRAVHVMHMTAWRGEK
mgnify:FL=1